MNSGLDPSLFLPADPKRQAVPTIAGFVYQALISIDSWLQLESENDVLILEGAEDLDIHREDHAVTIQVKFEHSSISLGQEKAHRVLENYWNIISKTTGGDVRFHYVSSGSIAKEIGLSLPQPGIVVWEAARTDSQLAQTLSDFLVSKLSSQSRLARFLTAATPAELQNRFFKPFTWVLEGPDLTVVRSSVIDRICVLLDKKNMHTSLAESVCAHLQDLLWATIVRTEIQNRQLTKGMLLRQFDKATTALVPVPFSRIPDLLANPAAFPQLLDIILEAVPHPPSPLLPRDDLVMDIAERLAQGQQIALTGSVGRGKTTVAQLVSATHYPTAWWVGMKGHDPLQCKALISALVSKLATETSVDLIVLDNVNTSVASLEIIGPVLALLSRRVGQAGSRVLLTTQELQDPGSLPLLRIVEIPALTEPLIKELCVKMGCADDRAAQWAVFIFLGSRGHPKLVQVRLNELKSNNWPELSAADMFQPSSAVESTQELSRRLMSSSYPTPVASFLYLASMIAAPMDKTLAILVASKIGSIENPGDVIDDLTGKWLEKSDNDRLRVTPLLSGSANNVWSAEQIKLKHGDLFEAIIAKRELNVLEAAALLFHAFFSEIQNKLARCAIVLQLLDINDTKNAPLVFKQLIWFPLVKLGDTETISSDPIVEAMLRGLQFTVACSMENDSQKIIASRWIDSVSKINNEEKRAVSSFMLWMSLAKCQSELLPFEFKLKSITGISQAELGGFKWLPFEDGSILGGTGEEGAELSATETVLLFVLQRIKTLAALDQFICWLEDEADEFARNAVENSIEKSLFQNMGAYLLTPFSVCYSFVKDWTPWIQVFDKVDDYALRKKSPNLGREAAKAKSIVLTEYHQNFTDGLSVLEEAQIKFGMSIVLTEQIGNVYFQGGNYVGASAIWQQLRLDELSHGRLDDPFAYRRFAISFAKLKKYQDAAMIFDDTAKNIPKGELEEIRFGLRVDAAMSRCQDTIFQGAAQSLYEAVRSLPLVAFSDNEGHWESVQRAAATICSQIEKVWSNKLNSSECLDPGFASNPSFGTSKSEPGQATRSSMLILQSTITAASLGAKFDTSAEEIMLLLKSDSPYIQFQIAQLKLSLLIKDGRIDGLLQAIDDINHAIAGFNSNQDSLGSTATTIRNDLEQQDPIMWRGLVLAAISCSSKTPYESIKLLAADCDSQERSALVECIQAASIAATDPNCNTAQLVFDTNCDPLLRGIAALFELERETSANDTVKLQNFISTVSVDGVSSGVQALFNRHMAVQFAEKLVKYCDTPFCLVNPSLNAPLLRESCEGSRNGNSSLKTLLTCANAVLGRPPNSLSPDLW